MADASIRVDSLLTKHVQILESSVEPLKWLYEVIWEVSWTCCHISIGEEILWQPNLTLTKITPNWLL